MKMIFLLLLALLSGCAILKPTLSPEQIEQQTQKIFEAIQNKPDWLFPAEICPAEVMPNFEREVGYLSKECVKNPIECFEKCKKSDGNSCYSLALFLEEKKGPEQEESRVLFLRSCKLGIVSGCTNNAAAKLNAEPESVEAVKCSADTFEKTCEKNDAWGCTMYGFSLFQGKGREQNLDEALKALTKSCRHGDDDPACQNAKQLKEQIEKLQKESRRK